MTASPPDRLIAVTFPDPAAAEAAVRALTSSGVPASAITIEDRLAEAPDQEAPFLWRLVIIIVLWSVLGGIVGAAIGLALALTVGPEGTAGLILQVVGWMIMGHLIVGMIAGYAVLADRTKPEMAPERWVAALTVRVGEGDSERVQQLLR